MWKNTVHHVSRCIVWNATQPILHLITRHCYIAFYPALICAYAPGNSVPNELTAPLLPPIPQNNKDPQCRPPTPSFSLHLSILRKIDDVKMVGPAADGAAFYDEALHRRQALMGKSGARALLKNFRVFSIAAFACIGGVLYGYNQVCRLRKREGNARLTIWEPGDVFGGSGDASVPET